MSDRALERIYLDLQCDYHLVQASNVSPRRAATVPALTIQGFVQWSELMLRAFPDKEARRLQEVVADLPLEAVTPEPEHGRGGRNPRERLPRRISRHLFPETADAISSRVVLRTLPNFAAMPASSCRNRCQMRRSQSREADIITPEEEDGGRQRSFTYKIFGARNEQQRGQRRDSQRYENGQYRYWRGGEREDRREGRGAADIWWLPTRRERYNYDKY